MKKIFGFLFAVMFLFGASFSLLSMIGVIPDSKVVEGEDLNDSVIEELRAEGILRKDESIRQFYSEDLFSFVDYGNFFTDKRVVSYEIDGESNERVIYGANFQEVTEIKFIEAESAIEDTYIAVYRGADEPDFYLAISTESGLDKVFYDELIATWESNK